MNETKFTTIEELENALEILEKKVNNKNDDIQNFYYSEENLSGVAKELLIVADLFTREEIELVSEINGWNKDTVLKCIKFRYNYDDLQELIIHLDYGIELKANTIHYIKSVASKHYAFSNYYNWLIDNDYFTEGELELITMLNDWNVETIKKIIEFRHLNDKIIKEKIGELEENENKIEYEENTKFLNMTSTTTETTDGVAYCENMFFPMEDEGEVGEPTVWEQFRNWESFKVNKQL